MRDISPFNFGLIIAYLIPGFVILWGISFHSATVSAWLAGSSQTAPTVGGLFFATLAAVGSGTFANFLRWAIIDTIHHRTGVRLPPWDFSRLQERLGAYQLLNDLHYKHYQFAANMLIAILITYLAYRSTPTGRATGIGAMDLGCFLVCIVLFFGSRDALRKYYRRAGELLSQPIERG